MVAGDVAFYSAKKEAAHDRGVKRVCIPNAYSRQR
jgi:hypothetical protein